MSRLIDADALIDRTDDRYSLGEIGRREHDDIVAAVEFAPTIEPERKAEKMVKILADVLDGSPLTQPCDCLWRPEGWCKEHCKAGQGEPDAECWLKYAEVKADE